MLALRNHGQLRFGLMTPNIGSNINLVQLSHLSDYEREQIGLLKAVGHSIGAIAQEVGRAKSTV